MRVHTVKKSHYDTRSAQRAHWAFLNPEAAKSIMDEYAESVKNSRDNHLFRPEYQSIPQPAPKPVAEPAPKPIVPKPVGEPAPQPDLTALNDLAWIAWVLSDGY